MMLKFTFASLIGFAAANHRNDCADASDVNNWFVNHCEEKCVCELVAAGQYAHVCYREREEFTCMSTTNRQRWLDAYKAVTTPGNPQYAQMQALIQKHGDGFWMGIHNAQFFLPWHRWYIRAVEDILRNVDCRITMPWWRWSKKSSNPFVGTPFHTSSTWLGGNGNPTCVDTGAFASPAWAPPATTCLKRSFQTWNPAFPTTSQISAVLNMSPSNYVAFTDALEGQIHNLPHMRIGGDMASGYSPREPAFFLHHAYIDQLWDVWQRKSSTHLNSYGGWSKSTQMPYTYGATSSVVDDHFDLKESRVRYVNIKSHTSGPGHFIKFPYCLLLKAEKTWFDFKVIEKAIFDTDPKILTAIPQKKWAGLTQEEQQTWWKLTRATEKGMSIAKERNAVAQRNMDAWNSMLRAPTEKFEDPSSQMLGIDVNVLAKMYKICEIGKKWDEKTETCVKDRKVKKTVKAINKDIKKLENVLGSYDYLGDDLKGR